MHGTYLYTSELGRRPGRVTIAPPHPSITRIPCSCPPTAYAWGTWTCWPGPLAPWPTSLPGRPCRSTARWPTTAVRADNRAMASFCVQSFVLIQVRASKIYFRSFPCLRALCVSKSVWPQKKVLILPFLQTRVRFVYGKFVKKFGEPLFYRPQMSSIPYILFTEGRESSFGCANF
jgi:hypothetical protein